MEKGYCVKRASDGLMVNIDPRFNIFSIDEIVPALAIYKEALDNGGILRDKLEPIPDNELSTPHTMRQMIIRKMKHTKIISPTNKLMFEYQVLEPFIDPFPHFFQTQPSTIP